MIVKQELLEKVPSQVKVEPHFLALLEHIKRQNIQTKEHLREYLQQEIAAAEQWIEEHRKSGTAVKTRRDKTTHLEVLKKCHKVTREFLF